MTERANDLRLPHGLAGHKTRSGGAEVRVERAHLHAVPVVLNDDVATVVGQARPGVDKRDLAVGDSVHRIDRLTVPVALEAFDIDAFVETASVDPHAAEHARLGGAFD